MNPCNHDLTEREVAVADGQCSICAVAEIARLTALVAEQAREIERLAADHAALTLAHARVREALEAQGTRAQDDPLDWCCCGHAGAFTVGDPHSGHLPSCRDARIALATTAPDGAKMLAVVTAAIEYAEDVSRGLVSDVSSGPPFRGTVHSQRRLIDACAALRDESGKGVG